MRNRIVGGGLAAVLALAGCQAGADPAPTLETNDQKASYAIGLNMGGSLAEVSDRIDMVALRAGIRDAMEDADPRVPREELQGVMEQFGREVTEAQAAEMASRGAENRERGQAYLAENAARDGVSTTESGLQYEVMRPADGPSPETGDRVRIHYRGTLVDGTEFDSSYQGGEPVVFGVDQVIPGFSEALKLMEVGSQYRFVIPSDLAYGPQGTGGDIGPDATLVFEIELLEIVE